LSMQVDTGAQKAATSSGLRPFVANDIKLVADLIWRVLHEHSEPAPNSLHSHLRDLFLENPWLDEGIASRVFQTSEGKIAGFFGALPRRMTLQGKRIRLAFGSNFVVDPGSRASMTAIQLVKAFTKGTQDISITDSANENSRPLLRSLGFQVVPVYSLHWARPLRPTQYAVEMFARMKKNRGTKMLGAAVSPACRVLDAMATGMKVSPLRQVAPTTSGEDLDTATLLQCLTTFPGKQGLVPEYDASSLQWVFDFITRRNALGALRKVLVKDKDGKTIGWFIYSVRPNSPVCEVLQIGGLSPSIGLVLDHLFYDAWKAGLLAVHGRMEPQFMQELSGKSCFFFRHGSWTLAHSAQPELAMLLQSGNAFFSRLDGEWCFRHGGSAS
jgi:hypothetical protein